MEFATQQLEEQGGSGCRSRGSTMEPIAWRLSNAAGAASRCVDRRHHHGPTLWHELCELDGAAREERRRSLCMVARRGGSVIERRRLPLLLHDSAGSRGLASSHFVGRVENSITDNLGQVRSRIRRLQEAVWSAARAGMVRHEEGIRLSWQAPNDCDQTLSGSCRAAAAPDGKAGRPDEEHCRIHHRGGRRGARSIRRIRFDRRRLRRAGATVHRVRAGRGVCQCGADKAAESEAMSVDRRENGNGAESSDKSTLVINR